MINQSQRALGAREANVNETLQIHVSEAREPHKFWRDRRRNINIH